MISLPGLRMNDTRQKSAVRPAEDALPGSGYSIPCFFPMLSGHGENRSISGRNTCPDYSTLTCVSRKKHAMRHDISQEFNKEITITHQMNQVLLKK
jgi:hypothetical protein